MGWKIIPGPEAPLPHLPDIPARRAPRKQGPGIGGPDPLAEGLGPQGQASRECGNSVGNDLWVWGPGHSWALLLAISVHQLFQMALLCYYCYFFFFFFNVKPKFLELHICMCGISGVRVISNLMYPYAFIFLPVLPSVFFNLGYDSEAVSFLPSFEGRDRSPYIEKAFLLSAFCICYRHNSKVNRKDRGRSKSPSPKKEVYQRRYAPGYTRWVQSPGGSLQTPRHESRSGSDQGKRIICITLFVYPFLIPLVNF